MHLLITHMLAASDDSLPKGVFIAIFVIIWLFSSIASSVKKSSSKRKIEQEQAQLRAVRQNIQRPAVTQARPRAVKRGRVAPPSARQQPARRPPPIPTRAAQPVLARPDEPVTMPRADSSQGLARAVQRPVARTATAAALNRWLNPTTLRQQFMLTEVFQPPVALRESHLE